MGMPYAAPTLVRGCRTMAILTAVICSRDTGCGVMSWSTIPTTDKAAQCTLPESTQEATQTNLASFKSAGCQTEAAFSETKGGVVNSGVSCTRCCKFFLLKGTADRHWRLHHAVEPPEGPQEPYCCPYCPFASETRKSVQVHERTHAEEEYHACKSPTRSCPQNTSPVTHAAELTNDKSPNMCRFCKKCFRSKKYVAIHERSHTGEKPYVCNVCQKRFSRREGLTIHVATHTKKKPFECDVCQKRFSHRSSLSDHKRLHREQTVKLYSCSVCKESFGRKSELADHKRTLHPSTAERPYVCIICREVFSQKTGLLNHECVLTRRRIVAASLSKVLPLPSRTGRLAKDLHTK